MLLVLKSDPPRRAQRGVAAMLLPPPDLAAALAVGDPGKLHLTVCFVGTADALGLDQVARATALWRDRLATWPHPLEAAVSGLGRFAAEGGDVLYASVDCPALEGLRHAYCQDLRWAGIEPDRTHGFTPHITLARLAPHEPLPLQRLAPRRFRFERGAMWVGGLRYEWPVGVVAAHADVGRAP